MNRKEKALQQVVKTRKAMQQQIRETYGESAIKKAKRKLCLKCSVLACFLLPITSDGKDCPYFRRREVEE